MKHETNKQLYERLILKACAEGEQWVADVPIGSIVSKIKDVTDIIAKGIQGKSISAAHNWWMKYSTIYIQTSTKCLHEKRPSLLIYFRNTEDTSQLFDLLDSFGGGSKPPGSTRTNLRVLLGPDFVHVARGKYHMDVMIGLVRQMVGQIYSSIAESVWFMKCFVCTTSTPSLTAMFKCEHMICSECIFGMWKVKKEHISCPQCRKGVRYPEELHRLVNALRVEESRKQD
jgi:hypothetical protein